MANTVPSGTILAFAGSTPPAGYLLCDGSPADQSMYPDLFAAIGYAWGGDPGPGMFRLPNLTGVFLRGAEPPGVAGRDPGPRYQQGNPGQPQQGVGSWENGDVQNHMHQWNTFFQYISFSGSDIAVAQAENSPNAQSNPGPITNVDGGSPGVETRPLNAAVTYIIAT
jgi:microcystin-dependent protein